MRTGPGRAPWHRPDVRVDVRSEGHDSSPTANPGPVDHLEHVCQPLAGLPDQMGAHCPFSPKFRKHVADPLRPIMCSMRCRPRRFGSPSVRPRSPRSWARRSGDPLAPSAPLRSGNDKMNDVLGQVSSPEVMRFSSPDFIIFPVGCYLRGHHVASEPPTVQSGTAPPQVPSYIFAQKRSGFPASRSSRSEPVTGPRPASSPKEKLR